MECLLPSEIARLVFGYLEEQKCEEAAQIFLEHSPYLSECLNVVKSGRKFSSRVQGSSLLDVLDEYCAIQNLVAERIRRLPENSSEQLRNCVGLVEKLRILLDNAKSGQTVAVSISVLPHGGTTQSSSTQGTTHSRFRAALNTHERKRSIRFQGQENTQKAKERDERNVSLECSVETTPLETLPGLSGQGSRSTQTASIHNVSRTVDSGLHSSESMITRVNSEDHFYSSVVSEQFCSEKIRSHSFSSTSTVPDKDAVQDIVNTCEVGTSTNTSPKRKLKKKCSSLKTSPLRIRKPLRDDDEEEEESVAATLHRALLNNTALHEKIAENINSVIRIPNDLGCSEVSNGPVGSEDCEGVIQELNNAIKMVVDKTQEDPVFERLLEEIIGPTDEDMSSSPTAVESETDDACEFHETLICNERIVIHRDADIDNRHKTAALLVPEPTSTKIIDGNERNLMNMLKDVIIKVSPVSSDQNSQSGSKTPDHCSDLPIPSVHEYGENNAYAVSFTTKSKTPKSLCEKSSKKHALNQSKENQGKMKGKQSSVNNVESQGCEGAERISKKELKNLFENSAPDTVCTPKTDIPLKQRLRSARKSDSNFQGSAKEISSADRSLEDQNAKAIQLILEANKKCAEETANSSEDCSTEEVNHNTEPSSMKQTPDVQGKLSNIQKNDNINRNVGKISHNSAEIVEIVYEKEANGGINPDEELNNELDLDNFADRPGNDLVSGQPDSATVEQLRVEKEEIMMLTIPSVVNTAPISSIMSQSQTQQITLQTSVGSQSLPLYSTPSVYLQKQDVLSQQQPSEHLASQLSVMTLSQSSGDSATGSSKQLIIDETNSSAVIICDSDVTYPPVFNQYLKGNEVKGNKPKKLRPLAPRPIRPKPSSSSSSSSSSFPLQLFTSDMTPQYIVTQVSPTPVFERRNISTTSSPGLLNVVNLTLPVISKRNEPSKKICVCTSEDCGKKCIDISENNINFIFATGGANSESCGDSELSSVSEHVPDNVESSNPSEKDRIDDNVQESGCNAREENSVGEDCAATNMKQPAQLNSTSAVSRHNQDETLDMSSLLILPEQMPKPRETPQAFIAGKSCLNTRRLSLSTPRRRTSHIRTLDFGTPLKSGTESIALKKSQTSPKPAPKSSVVIGSSSKVEFSVSPYKSLSNQVRNVRSSLFTSPDPPVDKKDERKSSKESSGNSQIIPIATRSPVTHLLGDWDKATGVGLIFNGVSPEALDPKNAEHRPTRITPKTLLFSPESESGSASDLNQTPPTSQDSSTGVQNVAQNVKKSENIRHETSLEHSGIKGNEPNTPNQNASPNSMPIKQKLKSRSWDADLRKLLGHDFEDVYVLGDTHVKDASGTVNENISPSKTSRKISTKDQSAKKLKKRENKRNRKRNDNSLDDSTKELNANKKSESKIDTNPLPMIETLEREKNLVNIGGSTSETSANSKENPAYERDLVKDSDVYTRGMHSGVSLDNQVNFASRKRKACNEMDDVDLAKQAKQTVDEEGKVGKSVEEVLENMFCEGEEDNVDSHATIKENRTVQLGDETLTKNISDVLKELSSTPRHEIESLEASSQAGNHHNSDKSVFDLKSGENNKRDKVETMKELSHSNHDIVKNKEKVVENDLLAETSHFSVKSSTITPELPKVAGNCGENLNKNDSLSVNKNQEKNTILETPIKDITKYLGKNFNPMTPGPIDSLFPMTPRVLSPSHQEDTPITKLLRSEPCINYSMIVTPSLPPTPNIMISPSSENQDSPTSYASRPTDYSSCSSYYNPSKNIDTPTKLEQELIRECNKIEQTIKDSHSEDTIVKCKENSSVKIDSVEELHQCKTSDEQNPLSTKELHLKDVAISQEKNIRSENTNVCSNSLSVMISKETESNETIEETSTTIAIEENISTRKDREENKNLAAFDDIADPEDQLTTFRVKKKSVNSENILRKYIASGSKSGSECRDKLNKIELPLQTKEKIPSNDNELRGKDSEKIPEREVSSKKQRAEETNVESGGENGQTKPMILQSLLYKTNPRVIGDKMTEADCSSQSEDKKQLQQEKESVDVTQEHLEKGLRNVPEVSGKVLIENKTKENQSKRNEIVSDRSKSVLNSSTKMPRVALNQDDSGRTSFETVGSSENNSSSKISEEDSQRKVNSCSSVKKVRMSMQLAGTVLSTEKAQISKDSTEKKERNPTVIKTCSPERLSVDNELLCVASGDERKEIHANNDNVTALKTISDTQIVKKNQNLDQLEKHETISTPFKTPLRKKLEETSKNVKKNSGSKMFDKKINKSISPQKSSKKQTVNNDLSLEQLSLEVTQSSKICSEDKTDKKDENNDQESPQLDNVKQHFVKRTPKTQEIACFHISQKSVRIQNSKVKSSIFKESDIQNNEYCEKFSEKNQEGKLNKESEKKENNTIMRTENEEKNGREHADKIAVDVNKEKDDEVKMNEDQTINVTGEHKQFDEINEDNDSSVPNEEKVSEKNKEEMRSKESEENREPCNNEEQHNNEMQILDVSVHCGDKDDIDQNHDVVPHKSEEISLRSVIATDCSKEQLKTELQDERGIEAGKIDDSLSEKQKIMIPPNGNPLQVNVIKDNNTAALNGITIDKISKNMCNSGKNSMDSEVEQLCINKSNINDNISSEQMEEICKRQAEKESSSSSSSSSESDSEESSGDSGSDSSEESSDDSSHSRISSVGETNEVLNESVLQEDNNDSLVKFSSDNTSKSGGNFQSEKEESANFMTDQSGSETINEILKSVSPVSYACKDMSFATELDKKKRRTLARLKGTEETEPAMKSVSKAEIKESKGDQFHVFQHPKNIISERSVDGYKYSEENSIEEFPVLHLSDSESAGNRTPHVSPMKSPFIATLLERCNSRKSDIESTRVSSERKYPEICIQQQEKFIEKHCNDGKKKEMDTMKIQVSCGKVETLENKRVNDDKKKEMDTMKIQVSCGKVETLENKRVSKKNITPELDNVNSQDADNLESLIDSRLVSITRLNENEAFFIFCFEGNFCPSPKIGNQTNFCYSFGEDDEETTITGSAFQDLMEIPSKDVCDKPNCTKHDQVNKKLLPLNRTITDQKKKSDKELCDSNSNSASMFGESDKQIQKSSGLRPLDLLYEEMMKSNDSSSLSDEADKLIKKRGKISSSAKSEKKKTSCGKSQQKLVKLSNNNNNHQQESMRYQSPLEMIPEYNSQKEDRNSKSYNKPESKTRTESISKSETVLSEIKIRSEDLEEGEILDSPEKESSSSVSARRGVFSRPAYCSGSRRSESSDGSIHSYSSHRSKSRPSVALKRNTLSQHLKIESHQSFATSSHHDDVRSLPPKKRKAVSEDAMKEPEKRARHDNPCKLLKNLNIDSFLNKLHGEDTSK